MVYNGPDYIKMFGKFIYPLRRSDPVQYIRITRLLQKAVIPEQWRGHYTYVGIPDVATQARVICSFDDLERFLTLIKEA